MDSIFVESIEMFNGKKFSVDYLVHKTFQTSLNRYKLIDLISSNLSGVKTINVSLRPEAIGYLSLSKYSADFDSQKSLFMDLNKLDNILIYGELEEDEYDVREVTFDFDNHKDSYTLEHGSLLTEEKEHCLYVRGRCTPHNNDVFDDFWQAGFDESGLFDEIDPDEKYSIYHRKGKDFYVGNSLELEQIELVWKDKDFQYSKDEQYESCNFSYLTYSEDKIILQKIKDALVSMREDFEFRSYIHNELKIDSYHDRWDGNDDVFDNINYDNEKTLHEMCKKVNNSLLLDCVTFSVDGSMEIERRKDFLMPQLNQQSIIKYKF